MVFSVYEILHELQDDQDFLTDVRDRMRDGATFFEAVLALNPEVDELSVCQQASEEPEEYML
jgi:hypothetical protein